MSPKRIVARAALVAVSATCGLILANWALGRWFPLPAVIQRADPELIYVPVSGARFVKSIESGGSRHWVTTEINSRGYRGRELQVPKLGARIAVYGDSFVFAEEVPLEQTFVERLGVALAPDSPPEMINAGVVGFGPDQACLRWERDAGNLAPDILVLVLYAGNDFGDLLRDKLFRLDAAEKAVRNDIVLSPEVQEGYDAWERAASQPAVVRLFRVLRDQWEVRKCAAAERTTKAAIEFCLARGREEYLDYVFEDPPTVRNSWCDHYDADVAMYPDWDSSRQKRRLMRAVLERMRDDCARKLVPFMVVIVPAPHDVCPDFEPRPDPALFPTWSPSRLTDTMAEILTDLRVPFVNLYTPFRAGGASRFYFGACNVHWNAAGQELAARLTARQLMDRGLWPPQLAHCGPAPRIEGQTTLARVPHERVGIR